MEIRHSKSLLKRSARKFGALWGLAMQMGCARFIMERFTKFISSGDSESPVTDSEVDHDAGTFENCHCVNSDRGQGDFASSWCASSEKD